MGLCRKSLLGGEIFIEALRSGVSGVTSGGISGGASGMAKGAVGTGMGRAQQYEKGLIHLLTREYTSQQIKRQSLSPGFMADGLIFLPSRENPFDLLGAMFIIEGLGNRMARHWGEMIREQLGLNASQVSFLLYHGEHDGGHFEKLETAVQSGLLTEERIRQIVKTAKVTARLYLLQLEVGDAIDSIAHLFGERPFAVPNQARNNLILVILALGDGWHANHHAFPNSARHGSPASSIGAGR